MSSSESRLPKLIAEGIVVVLSILVAFALDAWWEGQTLQRQLREELLSIESELQLNREHLAFQVDILDRIVVASDDVLRRLSDGGEARTIQVPDTLAAWIFSSPTLDPSLGAVGAMIASGRLSDVSDPILLGTLAGLRERFDDAIEDQLTARRQFEDVLHPLIADVSDFALWTKVQEEWWSDPQAGRPMRSYVDVLIPVSLAFRNAVSIRRFMHWVAANQMKEVDADLERAIGLIRASVG